VAGGLASAAERDPAVSALTDAVSRIEIGIGDVSRDSYKFGEYNGLQDKGVFGVGNIDLRGGGTYDSGDATRWRLSGRDLGLDTRSVQGEYGQQGRFRLTAGFDQLQRNRSDSFFTPYLNAGSALQTLPSGWIVPVVPRLSTTAANARGLSGAVDASSALVNGVLLAPTAAQLAQSNALLAADLPLFQQKHLFTRRDRFDAGLAAVLTSKWDFAVNARRDRREGAKPMGTVTRTTGADISTSLADPIDQTTDQLSATLGYRSKANFLQFAFYGSKFDNAISKLTWTNWAAPTATMAISSAPSNQSNQFSMTGGHDFGRSTRLVANASYTRSTQNAPFVTDASTVLLPSQSLDGLVVGTAGSLKLTSRVARDVNLALGYKYDERDNRTAVRTFGYYDANEAPGAANINSAFATALGVPATLLKSNVNINASRPYSRKLNQVSADADWHVTPTQAFKAAYEYQKIDRWCDGTWIDCFNAARTTEQTAKLEWRANPVAALNLRANYAYSKRKVDAYNEDAFLAIVPLANVSPSTAIGGASAYSWLLQTGLTGYGPVAGFANTTGNANLFFPLNNALANATYQNQNRISELIGMRMYNMADRRRDRLGLNFDWQALETVSLQADLHYYKDDYSASRYGLTGTRNWAANVEGAWNPTEKLALTVFYTHESQRAASAGNSYTANSAATNVNGFTAISGGCFATIALRNASNKIDPCTDWNAHMRDTTSVYGLTVDRKGFITSRLDLGGQLIVTRARSYNDVFGGNYVNNPLAVVGAPAGTIAAFYVPGSALPVVVNDSVELHLSARYALSAASTLRLAYVYGHLSGNDYALEGLQIGGLAGVLPTSETAPTYTVHVVALSYAHQF
jgi:MtrB/PioB family decaheme-associated outer membrane protein